MDESKLPPPATVQIDFGRDIKPILTNNCYRCHSGEKPKSHFLLTSRETALKGGNEGVDIMPGQSAKSPLIHYVSRLVPDMEMPPEGKGTPLTQEQVGLLRAWIDQGVAWEQTEPEDEDPVGGFADRRLDDCERRPEEIPRTLLAARRLERRGGEFELTDKPTPDSKITAAGHVLLNDYKLTLAAEKNDLGFTRFGWSQSRKYFDDSGGYYPSFSPPIFDLNRDLYLDTGRAWADFGLTLPRVAADGAGLRVSIPGWHQVHDAVGAGQQRDSDAQHLSCLQGHLGACPHPEVRFGLRGGRRAHHGQFPRRMV